MIVLIKLNSEKAECLYLAHVNVILILNKSDSFDQKISYSKGTS